MLNVKCLQKTLQTKHPSLKTSSPKIVSCNLFLYGDHLLFLFFCIFMFYFFSSYSPLNSKSKKRSSNT